MRIYFSRLYRVHWTRWHYLKCDKTIILTIVHYPSIDTEQTVYQIAEQKCYIFKFLQL